MPFTTYAKQDKENSIGTALVNCLVQQALPQTAACGKHRRYKVLSFCLVGMTVEEYFGEDAKEIPPVFFRQGWYCDRYTGKTWHEIAGRAFLDNRPDDFMFMLDRYDAKRLTSTERQAVQTLVSYGNRIPQLTHMLLWDNYIKDITNVVRANRRVRQLIVGM